MRKISISAEKSYDVFVGCNWTSELSKLIEGRSQVAIISSEKFPIKFEADSFPSTRLHHIYIPDGEMGKSSHTLQYIWDQIGSFGFTRKDLIVGIGGGAVTDISGFAASTWLRGIDWLAIPTTIAGMVDAAIGGKTGINSKNGKNLIGSFHSPSAVLIDLAWVKTLSDRDLSAGFAEVIKCGFIADIEILKLLRDANLLSLRQDSKLLAELIERSIQVKANLVSQDFKESFAREALNYGHTLGHAVEKHSDYSLRHGEAVAIGMIFMAELQLLLGSISKDVRDEHIDLIKKFELPTTYSRDAWPELLKLMAIDKKARGSKLRFVSLVIPGQTSRLEGPDPELLKRAYEKVSS